MSRPKKDESMLRKSVVALAVMGALNTAQVKALGLGEVTVHSALNQPLSAEINLLQLRDLARSQIIAGLADADDFYLAGVKPTAILSDINFQLDVKNGKGVIRLTTREPVREPFLNFLVEVNWPSGRLVREYTVLLDPPVFTAKDLTPRAAPAAPTVRSSPARTAKTAGSAMKAPATGGADASGNMRARVDEDSQYFVGVHDTLWNIALKTRPDRSISPQQMMLAIQRLNPDAFVNNNINRLKSGVVLDIPTKQQISSRDLSSSVEEVKRQNSAWKGTVPKGQASAKKKSEQLDAGKSDMAQPDAEAAPDQSKLTIVSKAPEVEPLKSDADKVVSADADADAGMQQPVVSEQLMSRNQELEEQLVVTLEGLDKVERDNAELFQRMEKLTEQLESVQRLLLLKDQQMSDLQNKLTEAQAAPAAPVPPAPRPEKGIFDQLMDSPAALGGGLAAILALLGGLLFAMRKRKSGDADDQEVEQAMAVLEQREQGAKAAESVPDAAAEEVAEEVTEQMPAGLADIPAAEEDPDDAFNMASDDDIGDEFDALISEDLDDQLGDDLDMDLKIDETVDEDPEMAEFAASLLNDEEYDLAVDEDDLDIDAMDAESVPSGESDADVFDEIMAEEQFAEADVAEEAGQESVEEVAMESEDTIDDDLDFILSDTAGVEEEPVADTLDSAEEDSDLDFIISETVAEAEAAADEEDEDLDSDALDAILGTDDAAVADSGFEADAAQLDDAGETDAGLETVSVAGEEEELLADGALDDLLNQAESHEVATEESAPVKASDDLDLTALDLDSLDLAAPEDETEILSTVSDVAEESIALAEEADSDLSLDIADSLSADELVAESLADVEDAASADTVEDSPLDLGMTDALEDALNGVPEDAEGSSVDLDAVNDLELEAELNQMLEEEGNALALEETDVSESEEELDYLDASDELGTKLDLARAYIDMDDPEGAKDILSEVLADGNEQQVDEARKMLDTLS